MTAVVIVDGVLTTAPIRGIIQLSSWCRYCDLAMVDVGCRVSTGNKILVSKNP